MIYARSTLSEVCAPRLFASIGGSTWFPRDFPERKPGEIEENRRPLQKKKTIKEKDSARLLPSFTGLRFIGFGWVRRLTDRRKKEKKRDREKKRRREREN